MVRAARSLVGTIPALPDVMIFLLLAHVWSALINLIWVARRTEQDKDVEILLLRQQLRILQRKQPVLCKKSSNGS